MLAYSITSEVYIASTGDIWTEVPIRMLPDKASIAVDTHGLNISTGGVHAIKFGWSESAGTCCIDLPSNTVRFPLMFTQFFSTYLTMCALKSVGAGSVHSRFVWADDRRQLAACKSVRAPGMIVQWSHVFPISFRSMCSLS